MMTCQMNNVNVFCLAMFDICVGGRMSRSSNENEGPLMIYSIHPIYFACICFIHFIKIGFCS
jgi:hypothetical protein